MKQTTAIITGASQRLGLHLTRTLLDSNWRVVALTRRSSPQLDALQCENLTIERCLDLDNPQLEQTLMALAARYPAIDLMVHNASRYEKDPQAGEAIEAFYTSFYRIHMLLPAILNRAFRQSLLNGVSHNPNIIHITDIYAENPSAEYALYCSTKAGLENLMKGFAKQFAPAIRVNSILPGPIKFLPEQTEEHKQKVFSQSLLAFEAGFEPISQTVQFIIENPFLTGSSIKVDGGRSIAR